VGQVENAKPAKWSMIFVHLHPCPML
jgi:hypothetical protein